MLKITRDDDLVAVFVAPIRAVAELVAGVLRDAGIACVVFASDFEQNVELPAVGSFTGTRVMVRASDAADAREIIDAFEVETEDDEG